MFRILLCSVSVECRYLLIPLVDLANHDDDVSFAICPGDGIFTGQDEVRRPRDWGWYMVPASWRQGLFKGKNVTLEISTRSDIFAISVCPLS